MYRFPRKEVYRHVLHLKEREVASAMLNGRLGKAAGALPMALYILYYTYSYGERSHKALVFPVFYRSMQRKSQNAEVYQDSGIVILTTL